MDSLQSTMEPASEWLVLRFDQRGINRKERTTLIAD